MTASREKVVRNKVGLHARPAALFVKTAAHFSARIIIENLTKGTMSANAKSILNILKAAVQMNDRVRIAADGDDEEAAVTALCDLVDNKFGETE
ncbi:MAG: HPr family phosphocarrier protein [Ktedonobacteraceae bacterium]